MKFSLSKASAALCVAVAPTALSEPHIGAGNFTLTRCPPGFGGDTCFRGEKPAVVYPAKEYDAPGYRDGFYSFIAQAEAAHLLTWEKEDDEPRNLTFSLGEYTLQKVIRSERAMNFTFKDLAIEMAPKSNNSSPERAVLASAMRSPWNSIEFKVWNDAHNTTYGTGIQIFYVLPANLYGFVQSTVKRQGKESKESLNKKWRIGVGVGVGVGVPLLMLASYMLGTRKSKKQPVAAKET